MGTALAKLVALPRLGSGLGFGRCSRLLKSLGVEARSTIGITGSNGKGSTATFAAALLTGAGIRTGLFTSPHFLNPTERFRIDGVPIESDTLETLAAAVLLAGAEIEKRTGELFSRFEILTAMAWKWFHDEKVEMSVMEAGIGGRFDPTRLGRPSVTAIASLDFEHTELLGNSLDQIFSDKLELTSRGGICFAALPSRSSLREYAISYAELCQIRLLLLNLQDEEVLYTEGETGVSMRCKDQLANLHAVKVPFRGPWQARNLSLALQCAQEALLLAGKAPVESIDTWINRSLSKAGVPGRLEKVHDNPEVFLDSAHTPDAIRQVVNHILASVGPDAIVLAGISASKAVKEIAGQISRLPFPVVVSRCEHGGEIPETVAHFLRTNGAQVIETEGDLLCAVTTTLSIARNSKKRIYVLGGLFFAADVCRILNGGSPNDAIYL